MTRQLTETSGQTHFDFIPQAMSRRPRFPKAGEAASLILAICAALLWATSLDQIDLRQMDDTGLVSVLPPAVLLSLLMMNVSFCIAISQRPLPMPLLYTHIVAQVFMLYGITAIVQEEPRFAIGWKLAGIVDYIMQTGTVDGRIDAFFNWPTFFILMAFLAKISGFDSALPFMGWAPVFFNLIYLGPLLMIFRAATSDQRLVVLAAWFFCYANWIGQDYLAPQALNFFFYLVILAVILTWLRGGAWQPDDIVNRLRRWAARFDRWRRPVEYCLTGIEQPVAASRPAQRAALVVILVLIMAAMASSHQLTPFATLAAVTVLVLFNRCTVRTLPLILGLLAATWIIFMATGYLRGHFEHISSPVGSLSSNIDANLSERFRGSPGHIFINYMRTGMSMFVWGLALLGGLRRLYNGHRDWAHLMVAVTPFPLLLLQAYGGELLLRIYLFSLPFMVFFGAALFFPSPAVSYRLRSAVMLGVVSMALLAGYLFARYGNERMMYFTTEEVAAMRYLYDTAEPGSQFVAATNTVAWRFQGYQTYKYTHVPRESRTRDLEAVADVMADEKYPVSYLILTRSQQAAGELYIGWPPGTWEAFEQALQDSPDFTLIYANEDASIYVLSTACSEGVISAQLCSTAER